MKRLGKKFGSRVTGLALVLTLCGCGLTREAKEAKFLALGKQQYAKKDYARAVIEFKNATRIAPNDAEAYYQLGLAYAGSEDPRAAYASFKKATDLNPKHADAQLKLASLMLSTGNKELREEAEKRVRTVVDSTPTSAEALNLLAFSELSLGKQEDAVGYLQQALSKFPASLSSSVMLMRIKLNQGDTAGAEEILKTCVANAPQSAEAAVALGRLYLVTKKFDQAERQIRRALEIDPKFGPALKDLGMLQFQQGRNSEAEQTFKRLSELPEKAFRPVHALFLAETGQRDAALQEFEHLAAQNPSDREARTRLITAYLEAGRNADAKKILDNALDKNRKDGEALVQRAALLTRDGKYAEAQNDLSQLLRFSPDLAQAHVALAALHAARGETLSERQELTEALRLNPALLPVRLHLARVLIASKAATAALDTLDKAFDDQKRILGFIVQRNWALLALGRNKELRQEVDRGLTAARHPDLLAQDAFLKIADKNYPAAKALLDESLKQNPENLPALEILVRLYAAQKNPSGPIEKIRALADQRPKSAMLHGILGNLLAASGKQEEARTAYMQAKQADPRDTGASLALAKLDLAQRKFDSARQELAPLQTSDPQNPHVWNNQGLLEAAQKDYPKALDNFRKALDLDSKNVTALNNLAYLMATHPNQAEEALKYAQKAKELAPDRSDVDDTLGWVLYNRGVYQSALQHLESAVKMNPDPAIRYHLAMTYAKVGDKRAPKMLADALKAAPELPEAQMANQLLTETAHRGK